MPPKKTAAATTVTPAAVQPSRKRPSNGAVQAKKVSRASLAVAPDSGNEESSSSDDGSDPDDDVADEDLANLDGLCSLDAECVRDASRGRVAKATRTHYDQFIGFMALFALRNDEYKDFVIKRDVVTFKLPLPISFVSAYLKHV